MEKSIGPFQLLAVMGGAAGMTTMAKAINIWSRLLLYHHEQCYDSMGDESKILRTGVSFFW